MRHVPNPSGDARAANSYRQAFSSANKLVSIGGPPRPQYEAATSSDIRKSVTLRHKEQNPMRVNDVRLRKRRYAHG